MHSGSPPITGWPGVCKLDSPERRQRAAVERGGEGGAAGVGDLGVAEVERPEPCKHSLRRRRRTCRRRWRQNTRSRSWPSEGARLRRAAAACSKRDDPRTTRFVFGTGSRGWVPMNWAASATVSNRHVRASTGRAYGPATSLQVVFFSHKMGQSQRSQIRLDEPDRLQQAKAKCGDKQWRVRRKAVFRPFYSCS